MKILNTIFYATCLISMAACNNNIATNGSTDTTNPTQEIGGDLVGTWHPVANDFRLDSIGMPTGKWINATGQDYDALKELGISSDAMDYTFKGNGTGYIGPTKTDEDAFTYNKLPNGKYAVKTNGELEGDKNTNAENVEEFYIDAKGQLIMRATSKPTLMGKQVIQNTFTLFVKK